MTILAWIATTATGSFLGSSQIQGLVILNYGLTFAPYQLMLLTWAVILICVFFNTIVSIQLPRVEGTFLVLHVLGFFAILIPLVYYSPHAQASDVFNTVINAGGWPTQGLSFMVGILGFAFAFVGADAAVHVREKSPFVFIT